MYVGNSLCNIKCACAWNVWCLRLNALALVIGIGNFKHWLYNFWHHVEHLRGFQWRAGFWLDWLWHKLIKLLQTRTILIYPRHFYSILIWQNLQPSTIYEISFHLVVCLWHWDSVAEAPSPPQPSYVQVYSSLLIMELNFTARRKKNSHCSQLFWRFWFHDGETWYQLPTFNSC